MACIEAPAPGGQCVFAKGRSRRNRRQKGPCLSLVEHARRCQRTDARGSDLMPSSVASRPHRATVNGCIGNLREARSAHRECSTPTREKLWKTFCGGFREGAKQSLRVAETVEAMRDARVES